MEASTVVAPEQPETVEPEPAVEAEAAPPDAEPEPTLAGTPGIVHLVDGKQLHIKSVEELVGQLEKDVVDVVRDSGLAISLLKHAIVAFEPLA